MQAEGDRRLPVLPGRRAPFPLDMDFKAAHKQVEVRGNNQWLLPFAVPLPALPGKSLPLWACFCAYLSPPAVLGRPTRSSWSLLMCNSANPATPGFLHSLLAFCRLTSAAPGSAMQTQARLPEGGRGARSDFRLAYRRFGITLALLHSPSLL